MKRLIVQALAVVGLVPARRYAALSRQARDLSKEARLWRKRAGKATARMDGLERQVKQQSLRLKELRAASERRKVANARDAGEWKTMETRLAETERALAIAREQLMAIEVKLDILEGAANVLDARTRTLPQRQPGPTTGAPV